MDDEYKEKLKLMHRRAQKAEGKLLRVMWWVNQSLEQRKRDADYNRLWSHNVSAFFIKEAKKQSEK